MCGLGFISNFISSPVLSGFTSAVSLTIAATHVKSLLGLHFESEEFIPTVQGIIEHIGVVKTPVCFLFYGN
jgi:SulP family sulfate permease